MKKILFPAAAAILLTASCSGNKETAAAPGEAVQNTETADISGRWTIVNISLSDSAAVRPAEAVPGSDQYFLFTDSTYTIATNCNTFAGMYTANGDSISLGDGMMTEMACDNMATEDALRSILPAIATMTLENDSTLRLNGAGASQFIELRKAAAESE